MVFIIVNIYMNKDYVYTTDWLVDFYKIMSPSCLMTLVRLMEFVWFPVSPSGGVTVPPASRVAGADWHH